MPRRVQGEGTMQWQDWLEDEDADRATITETLTSWKTAVKMLARRRMVLNDRRKAV